jgi:hypothetical protein
LERLAKSPFAIIQLGKFLSPKNGIRYGTGTPPPIVEPSKTSLPFIRATDIKGGEILVDGLLHIDSEQGQHMKKCLVEAGEMILVRSGANTGDCAVVPKSLAGSYAAYDLIVRFSAEALPDYVAAYSRAAFPTSRKYTAKTGRTANRNRRRELKSLGLS